MDPLVKLIGVEFPLYAIIVVGSFLFSSLFQFSEQCRNIIEKKEHPDEEKKRVYNLSGLLVIAIYLVIVSVVFVLLAYFLTIIVFPSLLIDLSAENIAISDWGIYVFAISLSLLTLASILLLAFYILFNEKQILLT